MKTGIDALRPVLVGPDDPEIVALEAALRDAQLAADVPALDRLIASEILFTGPDGQLGTKEQDLASYRSGLMRVREHQPDELRVRRVGGHVALVSLRTYLSVEVAGGIVQGRFRYTRVWAREDGSSWRIVGGHVAAVP